ncbi:MAG: NUDIX domain-containing protein [Candidatus Saccharibacteria bacterium]
MKIKQKVWVAIYKKVDEKVMYLALKPTPGPDYMYDYYVVTGSVEKGESVEDGAKREVKEETGLDVKKLINLKHQLKFDDRRGSNIEYCFGALVDEGEIILNEEHIGYKWMPKDEFIKQLWWFGGDKQVLAKLIDRIDA